MITTNFDSSGNPTSSTNTAQAVSSGGSGKSIIRLGYLWPSSGNYPTTMTAHREAVTDNGQTATVTQGDAMTVSGSVMGLTAYIYGSTGGGTNSYTWTLYKNGVATGLTCSSSRTDAGPAVASSPSVSFVAGDLLQVFSMATAAATPQATKASLTVTLN